MHIQWCNIPLPGFNSFQFLITGFILSALINNLLVITDCCNLEQKNFIAQLLGDLNSGDSALCKILSIV